MADPGGQQGPTVSVAPPTGLARTAIAPPAVAVRGLSRSYGGIRALVDMDLEVRTGSVHAIVGENGAGKSTLMKLLAGAISPDAGEIRMDGQAVRFTSPQDARGQGVGIVYQELSLFPDRSILANVFPDHQPTRRGLVDVRTMRVRATPVLRSLGLRADPDTLVGDLGLAERQLVEIGRVLVERPRVLILDEPNSALDDAETQRLFEVLRELVAGGITILYVSHRLEEVFSIADVITTMRNGTLVWTRPCRDVTIPVVVEAMVGSSERALYPAHPPSAPRLEDDSPPAVEVRDLTVGDELLGVSFQARPGEIIGLAGLEGSGVATLLGVLFGTRRATGGTIRLPDGGGAPTSPTQAARRSVALVPADRRHQGLMLDRSVARNISVVSVGTLRSGSWWLRAAEMRAAAYRQIERLRIKVRDPGTPVDRLSGGNQQKVVIGKWLEVAPRVMLLDDPTRGVDVGAKREIYLLIRALADDGRVVLFRSTELPELVGLADRILVFYRGRLTSEIAGVDATDHGVLHAINTGEVGS